VKRVERMERLLIRSIESRSFIPKIEELREGIDIYCGSRNEAIAALNTQSLGFLRTEKLAGEKNGRRLYRTTLLVRL
jgi:NMD protein affecting ribosome stability and mRNA decay